MMVFEEYLVYRLEIWVWPGLLYSAFGGPHLPASGKILGVDLGDEVVENYLKENEYRRSKGVNEG